MFHVVFNVNDNYVKYLSVLCYSIVENATNKQWGGGGGVIPNAQANKEANNSLKENITLDCNKDYTNFNGLKTHNGNHILENDLQTNNITQTKRKTTRLWLINQIPFNFHILTDNISQIVKNKIKALEKELNTIYPCQFSFHILSDSVFHGLPKLNGNYLAYFRLKMGSCLPQDIETCLYLDVDMLCVSDIRSIFNIDLQEKVCAVVLDADYSTCRIMESRCGDSGYALNINTYFNSGFMLINLVEWRKQNIEQKCFDWLLSYTPKWFDQDVLNAILSDKISILPLEWNFMISHVENRAKESFKGDSENYSIIYTYKEYTIAKGNIKILHYLTERKPWHTLNFDSNSKIIEYPYRDLWWEIALKTPIFYSDLQILYMKLQEQMLIKSINLQIGLLSDHTQQIYYLRKPHKRMFRSFKKIFTRLLGKDKNAKLSKNKIQ